MKKSIAYLYIIINFLLLSIKNLKLSHPVDLNEMRFIQIQIQQNKTNENYFVAKLEHCNKDLCLENYGECSDATTCKCKAGYANVPGKNDIPEAVCSYQQKKQIIAFLLELLLPFGGGQFYIGFWAKGVIKLLFFIVIPVIWCVINMIFTSFKDTCSLAHLLIPAIYACCYFIWYFVDIILIGLNTFKDINGVELYTW